MICLWMDVISIMRKLCHRNSVSPNPSKSLPIRKSLSTVCVLVDKFSYLDFLLKKGSLAKKTARKVREGILISL